MPLFSRIFLIEFKIWPRLLRLTYPGVLLLACARPPALASTQDARAPQKEKPSEDSQALAQQLVAEKLKKLMASEQACVDAVNYKDDFERCFVLSVGQGTGLFVQVVTECGGDSCSTESFLIDKESTIHTLPQVEGGSTDFDAQLQFYVTDVRKFLSETDRAENYYTRAPVLQRVDLDTGRTSIFARCMSPVLDPSGTWFLCRNRSGDVLRVPTVGGQLELVVINPAVGEIHWSPYAYIYPGPVEFLTASSFTFGQADDSEKSLTRSWNPGHLAPQPARRATREKLVDRAAERPTFCHTDVSSIIGSACQSEELGAPSISADGSYVELIDSWTSCCTESAHDTIKRYLLESTEALAPVNSSELIYETNETGQPSLSVATTTSRVKKLVERRVNEGSKTMRALPLPESPYSDEIHHFRLGPGEDLIWNAAGARLLKDGEVVWLHKSPRQSSHAFCCPGKSANDDGSWENVEGCLRTLFPHRGWYSEESRALVLQYEDNTGGDGCELGPVYHVGRLP